MNFNLILYMGFWKSVLVPPFWAMWAWTRVRSLMLKCIFVFLGVLMGNICAMLHAALGILCAFPLQMMGMYVLLPAHCLWRILRSATSARLARSAARSAGLPAQMIGHGDDQCARSSSHNSSGEVMPALRAQDLLRAGLDFWKAEPAEPNPSLGSRSVTLQSVTPSTGNLSPTDRLWRVLRRSYSRQQQQPEAKDDSELACCPRCFPGNWI